MYTKIQLATIALSAVSTLSHPVVDYNDGTKQTRLRNANDNNIQRVPDAEYLGYGYHIYKAEPFANGKDPAFASNILELKYDEGKISSTAQGEFLKPDMVDLSGTISCTTSSESKAVENTEEYQESLSVSVSVEGSAPTGGAASLSTGYKQANSGSSASGSKTVIQNGFCTAYQLRLQTYNDYGSMVSENFKSALKILPKTYDANDKDNTDAFGTFFNTFGTHMVIDLTLGGRVTRQTKFTHSAYTKMESSGVDVEAAASASYAGFTAGVSTQTETQKQQASTFDSSSSSSFESFTGGSSFSKNEWSKWQETVRSSPAPVKYSLMELHKVIRKLDDEYTAIADVVQKASDDLCAQTPECIPNPENNKALNVFGGMYQVDDCNRENFGNYLAPHNNMECPRGYEPHLIGRHKTQLNCGASTYLCLPTIESRKGKPLEMADGFGGAFSRADTSMGEPAQRHNPFTGDFSCPDGSTQYQAGRVRTEVGDHGFSYYFCLEDVNNENFNSMKRGMGGLYQIGDDNQEHLRINNPKTQSVTCSSGFTAVPWMRGQSEFGGDESHEGINAYICL